MIGRKLSREEYDQLELSSSEKQIGITVFNSGGDVWLTNETKDGYDFAFVINPKAAGL